ncbi:SIS domain-containing protein [Streptomyces sp. NPDC090029]|uniref:SIS domain-containing protein n=1 Tax=Streptomyces sp. NPDC090029 TaxID=3365924 RepID=UPI0038177B2B
MRTIAQVVANSTVRPSEEPATMPSTASPSAAASPGDDRSSGAAGTPPGGTAPPSFTEQEIASQPACWRRAAALAGEFRGLLPRRGERVAVVGCGTSWFVAQSYAALREAGGGYTDAFAASEFPLSRRYDRILAVTRSGTTTEVLDLLDRVRGTSPTTALTAAPDTPVTAAADRTAVLDFADERSVVQTRYATTALALLRAALEADGTLPAGVAPLADAAGQAESAVSRELPEHLLRAEQFTFLGTGWSHGLALEAALKLREAAGAWTEAYPAMEYRHGPLSIAAPNRVVWTLGPVPGGLAAQIAGAGAAHVHHPGTDPLAELVLIQRLAVQTALAAGRNPDAPRHLTRSVVLDGGRA